MWLKKLVGVVMIVTLVGMNVLVVLGLIAPQKKTAEVAVAAPAVAELPTVTLSASPSTIPAQTTSSLSWSSTGSPTDCTASGSWTGVKTPFGAESTGRINVAGNYTYTLECTNAAGSAKASSVVTVGDAIAPKPTASTSTAKPSATPGTSYCLGRTPCYGAKDVAGHGASGNCWGYNIDRVINISGFDAAYHQVRSGIGTIQVASVCGKDLAAALSGGATAEGQTRVHKQTTKTNGDKNVAPYFVGYYDASK